MVLNIVELYGDKQVWEAIYIQRIESVLRVTPIFIQMPKRYHMITGILEFEILELKEILTTTDFH